MGRPGYRAGRYVCHGDSAAVLVGRSGPAGRADDVEVIFSAERGSSIASTTMVSLYREVWRIFPLLRKWGRYDNDIQ